MLKRHKEVILLIGTFTLIRLLVAPTFGLGVDEAHYVLYAKYLALGYVDHPPLVGWIHALFYYTLGTSEFIARLPAIAFFALTSLFAYRFLLAFSGSKNVAFIGVLALNSSFILNALGIMLLPDCILLLLIFPLIHLIKKIESGGQKRDFLLLGVILGLAGLAKYTAILLVPPIFIYMIIKKRYDLIFSSRMILAGILALFIVSPVFFWNLQHDFISFRYQASHVLGPSKISLEKAIVAIAAQFGAYSPFLFVIAFYGFFKSIKSRDDLLRLASLFGGVIYAFFLYSSFYETALPHWTSIFYTIFIPIGVYFLMIETTSFKRWFLKLSLVFSLILTLFLYAELANKFISYPDYNSPFRDIIGYRDIAIKANEIVKSNPHQKKALAVSNWTMGSRVMYYSSPYDIPVFVIDERRDQFDVWQKTSPEGYDLLFINSHFSSLDLANRVRCDRTYSSGVMDITMNERKVDTFNFEWCTNFQGLLK